MNGLHLIADLHDCRCTPARLCDAASLEADCVEACQRHGLTVVGQLFHPFPPVDGRSGGVTGAVVLAESHLAIHTWPELASVTLDLYVCNYRGDNRPAAQALFNELIRRFAPGQMTRHEVTRGDLHRIPALV